MATLTLPRLIVFARYPTPGRAKTRLIPLLGPRGAAGLHRHLTARLLARARPLALDQQLTIEVRYTGGSRARMAALFGDDVRYTPQGGGDLGDRMRRATGCALDEGAPCALVVGTDVPALDARVLGTALGRLRTHDVVLGPTTDGGYYLVGLKAPAPALFRRVDWGTSSVLEATLRAATRAGLSLARLRTLDDVDEPGDVPAELLAEVSGLVA